MVTIPSLKVCEKVNKEPKKRASLLSAYPLRGLKGSMTIEGSLLLPIFLFFMLTIMLSIEMVRFQSNLMEALHQTGNLYAVSVWQNADGTFDADAQIKAYLDEQFLPYICVEGKKEGLIVRDMSSIEESRIEIISEYRMGSLISYLPVGNIVFEDRVLSHPWTGYSGEEEYRAENERIPYVYVTKTGEKYHLSSECSYLKVQKRAVEKEWLKDGRNKWGGKYYPCKSCENKGSVIEECRKVYITDDGNRYHNYADCPALKRTIYMIPLSEAKNYAACKRCGG